MSVLTPDVVPIPVDQYFPYEQGGKIFWFKNLNGIEMPVSTATYSLWNEVNPLRPNCGTPEYISSLINRKVVTNKKNTLSWTVVHSWSDFGKSSKVTKYPAIGVNPVRATENLLSDDIKTISINELLWRVRMKYKPEQTKKMIKMIED